MQGVHKHNAAKLGNEGGVQLGDCDGCKCGCLHHNISLQNLPQSTGYQENSIKLKSNTLPGNQPSFYYSLSVIL